MREIGILKKAKSIEIKCIASSIILTIVSIIFYLIGIYGYDIFMTARQVLLIIGSSLFAILFIVNLVFNLISINFTSKLGWWSARKFYLILSLLTIFLFFFIGSIIKLIYINNDIYRLVFFGKYNPELVISEEERNKIIKEEYDE